MNTAANFEHGHAPHNRQEFSAEAGSCSITVAEGYERWANTYDRVPNPLIAREERYLLSILGSLQGKRVLDLACGTGRCLDLLMRRGADFGMGIDSSPAMLRVGRTKARLSGLLVEGACESLPLPASSFELAVCSFALGHFWDLSSIARELARVTKPGADVLVSDLHPEAYARGWRIGFRDAQVAFRIEMLPRTMEEITYCFAANGFEGLRQESLWLETPEEPLFERAGKSQSFATACQIPAVFACHLRRNQYVPYDRRAAATGSPARTSDPRP